MTILSLLQWYGRLWQHILILFILRSLQCISITDTAILHIFCQGNPIVHIIIYKHKDSNKYYRSGINAIFTLPQTMAATKRNAGLPSAVPRASLNDEELVSLPNLPFILSVVLYHYYIHKCR